MTHSEKLALSIHLGPHTSPLIKSAFYKNLLPLLTKGWNATKGGWNATKGFVQKHPKSSLAVGLGVPTAGMAYSGIKAYTGDVAHQKKQNDLTKALDPLYMMTGGPMLEYFGKKPLLRLYRDPYENPGPSAKHRGAYLPLPYSPMEEQHRQAQTTEFRGGGPGPQGYLR